MLQKLAEPLEVPFQLTYVHRDIVGGLVGGDLGETDGQSHQKLLNEVPLIQLRPHSSHSQLLPL